MHFEYDCIDVNIILPKAKVQTDEEGSITVENLSAFEAVLNDLLCFKFCIQCPMPDNLLETYRNTSLNKRPLGPA